MKYSAVPGDEQARIYRDRLRALELEHVRLSAAQLAGDDVSKEAIADLEEKMTALEDAASKAESDGKS